MDEALDFVAWLKERCGRSERKICTCMKLSWGRYQGWKKRRRLSQPLKKERSCFAPRIDAPLKYEVEAVKRHALKNPADGYRRLTWQMIDEDIAYLSESSVYRILLEHDLLYRWARPRGGSGSRPPEPTKPHERWHTDIMYLQLDEVWYFLVSFIDSYSRYIVHWELLRSMTAEEVTSATRRALEMYPSENPEVVTDRGCQYTGKEFKKLVKQFELKHILCRVRHPQSNGIIERYHRTTREALEEKDMQSLGHAREVIACWVKNYNNSRLHAGLGYLRPVDYFSGNPKQLQEDRRRKLAEARELRIRKNTNVRERRAS
jgi:transposase InsO family protein